MLNPDNRGGFGETPKMYAPKTKQDWSNTSVLMRPFKPLTDILHSGVQDIENIQNVAPDTSLNMPQLQAGNYGFAPGNDTQLVGNLRLSNKADWGSLIKNPQAFQGSGLAELERSTQRSSTGYTPWESLMLAKQRKEQGGLLGDLRSQGSGAQASDRAALISRAGLRGGAAERLAGRGAANQMAGASDLATKGMLGRIGIGGQAEGMRLGDLQQVSKQQQGAWGTEQGLKQSAAMQNAKNLMAANQYDIMNVLKERRAKEEENQFRYGQGVKGWIGQNYSNALAQQQPPKSDKFFEGLIGGKVGGLFGY